MNDKKTINDLLEQIKESNEDITNVEIMQFKEEGSHETIITFTVDRNNA